LFLEAITMADQPGAPDRHPLVSIGVPVFNGERFLPAALDSLLGQSLPAFELIISDNASTDATGAICEDYVRRDRRVRYIRQPTNIGAPRNWNVLVHESRGTFFKWASANDYCAPTMLERCVKVLQEDPTTVLCYGLTQLMDGDEQPIPAHHSDHAFRHEQPSKRFEQVCTQLLLNNAQSGVFRLDVLRLTRLDRPYPGGDMVLMAELALYGRFQLIPEFLLFRRQSRQTFTAMLTPLERQRIYDPNARRPMRLIHVRRHVDRLISISRSPLSVSEKLRAIRFALRLAKGDRATWGRELLSLLGI
jgi:glycosyltransferase involved in cell wall biosynthesis